MGGGAADSFLTPYHPAMHGIPRFAWIVAACCLGPASSSASGQGPDAQALFLQHCATCHGENGDGKGVTELDRPARSFKDGGFSFGNTPEALFRTLTNGIPGTPMPAFDAAIDDEGRRALAAYVIELGPGLPPPPKNTEMVVGDRPRVVRGHLPPIAEGASAHPRGLLIGTTTGMTFEYRTDDVRLLGARQGGFVDRRDWAGRGGDPLQPLGKVVYLFDGGKPEATFTLLEPPKREGPPRIGDAAPGERGPLEAVLAGTWVRGDHAGLRYRLVGPDGVPVAMVEESSRAIGTSVGAGFVRQFQLTGESAANVRARLSSSFDPDARVADFPSPVPVEASAAGRALGPTLWTVVQREEHLFECIGVHLATAGESDSTIGGGGGTLWIPLTPGGRATAGVTILLTTEWSDAVRSAMLQEVYAR